MKRVLSSGLLFILVLCVGFPAQGQSRMALSFERIAKETGLSHSSIRHIEQDEQGFLWIGTEDGLNRFDGQKMVVFRNIPEDAQSLSSNFIEHLSIDKSGNLWIATVRGLNKLDPQLGYFKSYTHQAEDSNSLPFNQILTTLPTSDGLIWLGGPLLASFDPAQDKFRSWKMPIDEQREIDLSIENIISASSNELLIGTNRGLYHFNYRTEKFTYIDLPKKTPQASPRIIGIYQDRLRQVWTSTTSGVFQLNEHYQIIQHFKADPLVTNSISDYDIPVMLEDAAGYIWMGSFSFGLNRLDPKTGEFQHFRHRSTDAQSLSDNIVWSLLKDHQGNLWIGTNNGLNRLEPGFDASEHSDEQPRFELVRSPTNSDNSISGSAVRTILQDQDGYLWIGTDGRGLNRIDQRTGQVSSIRHDPNNAKSLPSNRVRVMIEDTQQNLWVGSFGGVSVLTAENRRQYAEQISKAPWRQLRPPHLDLGDQFVIQTRALCASRDGKLWIGSSNEGIFRWDPQTNEFTNFTHDPTDGTSLASNEILTIYEDRAGKLWVGTFGGGLNYLDRKNGTFTRFQHRADDSKSLSDDFVWALHEDQQGQLWVGTQGGLNCMLSESPAHFRRIREKDGLPNNVIYGILEDQQERLWLSSNKGLAAYDAKNGRCFTYDMRDGLQADEFNPNAYCTTPSGQFFFGGVNGYNAFFPATFQLDTFAPPVRITSLTNYREIDGQNEKLERRFLEPGQTLTFSHQDNLITFGVSMLNFRQPHKNNYQYRLQGLQDSWFPLEDDNHITFTNLPAGNYKLQVRGANHHGIWQSSPTELSLLITPPWWWSKLAITLYALAFAVLTINLYRYQLNRQLAERETKELRKLDALKTKFFTNISHEFRTPLTMILGPAKRSLKALSKNKVAEAISDHRLILQNGQRLLSLINEILDINKLEAGKLVPQYVQTDIIDLLEKYFLSFQSLAEEAGIQLRFKANPNELDMDVDPAMIEKIVANLLSNAIKFTPANGTVSLQATTQEGSLKLQVSDTGIGIPLDQLPFIFDRFYQVNTPKSAHKIGTGVGLSLAKELTELQGGHVQVHSMLGKGTTFIVLLPIHQKASIATPEDLVESELLISPKQQNLITASSSFPEHSNKNEDTQVLIVEDNADMADYIASCLGRNYQIDFALNGRLGLEKAIQDIPDMIITDVMMPEMDGFELCQCIKSDERTNHIPVIILTARTGMEQKLTGLRIGADAYLSKPFNEEELQVRVEQLLLLREQLKDRWQESFGSNSSESTPGDGPMDESFVARVKGVITQNLQATAFEVEDLAREMRMSESQLRRKLSALTGLPPIRFIRSLRVQRAEELLVNTKLNIAQIAYETGFSDPKYFSRIFSRSTGHSPSDFRKSKKSSRNNR